MVRRERALSSAREQDPRDLLRCTPTSPILLALWFVPAMVRAFSIMPRPAGADSSTLLAR